MRDIIQLLKRQAKRAAYILIPQICKLVGLFPRNNHIWAFGTWKGKIYGDNSKYLFEYVNKEHPEIHAVWISRNHNVVNQIREKGFEAYYNRSLKGIYYCLRSGVTIMTEDTHDISRVLIFGSKMIQLWHGMGIKDVRAFKPKKTERLRQYYTQYTHPYAKQFWMTACPDGVKKYSEAFSVPKDHMFITGQPKDDTFVLPCHNAFVENLRKLHDGCKVVAYLPTHRYFGNRSVSPLLECEVLLHVNDMLHQKNIVMIFKPHIHEFANYQKLNNMSNIVVATDVDVFGDVYEFLPACDGMITDYSGIMLGYLTGEKPIIYFPYDMDEYMRDDAGFCYKYDEIAAGPVCKTWEEVVDETDRIFREDAYASRRNELRMRFSPYADGKNRERVYKQIQQLVNE